MRNKPKLAEPPILRDKLRDQLARLGIEPASAIKKIDAPPMEEGHAGREAKRLLEQAIARFNPDSSFTNNCLTRMAFSDRYLGDKEKLVVLEMVGRYAENMQQLTLVNFIGYLRQKRSDEAHLPGLLANMKQTNTVLDVGPYRRSDDSDLLRLLNDKPRKPVRTEDVDDKDY